MRDITTWFREAHGGHDGRRFMGDNEFSLNNLLAENPGLAAPHLWRRNPPLNAAGPLWIHFGCGARVFDGFANIDLCPQDARVIAWDLLGIWPHDLDRTSEGAFSEDCLEHFFRTEQAYILCNLNRALRDDSTARILMPGVHRLIESYLANAAADDLRYALDLGLSRAADMFNHGMRFTGHRWLHDDRSFADLAVECGFETTSTSCHKSTVDELSSLNLRSETDSASFATDLKKRRPLSRIILSPSNIDGADFVARVSDDCDMFRINSDRSLVQYRTLQPLRLADMACINIRSSNLSCFDWNLKGLYINSSERQWRLDETMKSQPCMNVVTGRQLQRTFGDDDLKTLSFIPGSLKGQYFTLGPMEAFVFG
jgi:predicted SAM-dependent methyltransferase